MRANLAALSLLVLGGAAVCSAQTAPETAPQNKQADYTYVYCSGFLSDQKVPDDIRVISGEQSSYKVAWVDGEYVYINRGADKGVKVGDRFSVVRTEHDEANEWFRGQYKLQKEMGTLYQDVGQVRVVNVQPKVAIAKVEFICGYLLRGDIARPFEERPTPPFKDAASFDHFAPTSGKPVGKIVATRDNPQALGRGDTMYVTVGASKGVKVGDYMRVYRYQGMREEYSNDAPGLQYRMDGFGSNPTKYEPKDLPREVLGEGIVLNVTKNAATVLLTYVRFPPYTGDLPGSRRSDRPATRRHRGGRQRARLPGPRVPSRGRAGMPCGRSRPARPPGRPGCVGKPRRRPGGPHPSGRTCQHRLASLDGLPLLFVQFDHDCIPPMHVTGPRLRQTRLLEE